MIATLKLSLLFFLVILLTVILLPLQLFSMFFSPWLARKIPILWHRFVLALAGTRVTVHGDIPVDLPQLIVSNHVSWSDIMILGSITELCFIAKSEVKQLPGLNGLAWLQRSVFVDRQRKSDTAMQANTIAARLLEGDRMVLFAEGTTNDGHRVYPFKSALLGGAQYALKTSNLEQVKVLPVAIAYSHLHGMPLGRYHQSEAAWPGEIPLPGHFLNFFKKGAYDVQVCIGPPVAFTRETNRRQLSAQTHEMVSTMFADVMRGRK